ncbi:MAG: HAD family hydrolase [Stellaceae bacterium]
MPRVVEPGASVAPPGVAAGRAPPILSRPRAILFDWDNTLVDSWATIHHAVNAALNAMSLPEWSLTETKTRLSLPDIFPRHFGTRWEEARGFYLAAFEAVHLGWLTPLPGSVEVLQALSGTGVFLGVVSNKTGSLLRREAERLGWTPYFGSIIGGGDAAALKPDAAPALLALAGSGIAVGEEVWLVGDTAIDMLCARNAGCLPVLLGAAPAGVEFVAAPPRLTFSDGPALIRFVQDL